MPEIPKGYKNLPREFFHTRHMLLHMPDEGSRQRVPVYHMARYVTMDRPMRAFESTIRVAIHPFSIMTRPIPGGA
jgi:hypothetical protein